MTTLRQGAVSVPLLHLTFRSFRQNVSPTGLLGLGARARVVRFGGASFAISVSALRLLSGDMPATANVAVATAHGAPDPGRSRTVLSLRQPSLPITQGPMRTLSTLLAGRMANTRDRTTVLRSRHQPSRRLSSLTVARTCSSSNGTTH